MHTSTTICPAPTAPATTGVPSAALLVARRNNGPKSFPQNPHPAALPVTHPLYVTTASPAAGHCQTRRFPQKRVNWCAQGLNSLMHNITTLLPTPSLVCNYWGTQHCRKRVLRNQAWPNSFPKHLCWFSCYPPATAHYQTTPSPQLVSQLVGPTAPQRHEHRLRRTAACHGS